MNEEQYAKKLVTELNDGLNGLGSDVLRRLQSSREQACEAASQQRGAPYLRSAHSITLTGWFRQHRLGAAGAMLLVVLALASVVWEYAGSSSDDDTAAVDTALLAGELPVNAYLDTHLNKWANAN